MKASNSFTGQRPEKKTFSLAITSNTMQNLMLRSLGDSKAVSRLTSTLISAVSASEQLRNCEAATIVAAALRGEGMGLIYGHGYYLVPYGQVCTFLTSYKGYIQLAIASGQYADLDCVDVRKGELAGRDRRTGKPIIDLSVYETDEEREKQPIIGYYAYFELKDGTFRYEYWSLDKLLKHADRYSQAFSLMKYKQLINGELNETDTRKCLNGTPWYDVNGGQDRMCRKTVLKQLLNSGYAPLSAEVRSLLNAEGNTDDTGVIIAADGKEEAPIPVDTETGEVLDSQKTAEIQAENAVKVADDKRPTQSRKTAQTRDFDRNTANGGEIGSFFADEE